jgi:ABC-2 type transport system permease protein
VTTHLFGDTAVLTGRSLRHITRSPDTIITTTIMPIAFMLLFVYVFGGAISKGSDSYVDYLLPGILLITIASGISYTAFRLFTDMQSGIFERFQSMPIARSSVLWAHVLTSLVANQISLVLVVLVALLMGFRSGAGVLARGRRHPDPVHPGVDVDRRHPRSHREVRGRRERVRLPADLPAVHQLGIRAHRHHARTGARLREYQPVTVIVNAIRDLFTQQPVGTDIWIALAWCVGFLIVAYSFAMATYRRRIS